MGKGLEHNISPNKTHKLPTGIWKNAQYNQLLGKCKSRLQWNTTSYIIWSVRMVILKKDSKYWQGWGEIESLITKLRGM